MGSHKQWTEEESRAFALKVFEKWKAHPLDAVSAMAKQVMKSDWPEDRRKSFASYSLTTLRASYTMFCDLVRAYHKKAETGSENEPPPMPTIIEVEKPVQMDAGQFMRGQPLEVLVLEVMARFTRRFDAIDNVAELVQGIALKLEQRRPDNGGSFAVKSPTATTVKMTGRPTRRIGVVGLFKEQFEHVREKVGDRAELVFMDKDLSKANVPNTLTDVVVQKHVRHYWFEEARSKYGNDHVFFVDGGESGVVQKIYDVCARQA